MNIYHGCVLEPENGDESVELDVYDFKSPGVALAMYNVDEVCPFTNVTTSYGISTFSSSTYSLLFVPFFLNHCNTYSVY